MMRPSRHIILVLTLVLAACGDPPPRPPVPGQEAHKAMDAAAGDYKACVDKGAASVDLATLKSGDVQAGTAATQIIKSCIDARQALVARVLTVRRFGYDKEAMNVSEAVADQSVAVTDQELRDYAVGIIVGRQVDDDKSVSRQVDDDKAASAAATAVKAK